MPCGNCCAWCGSIHGPIRDKRVIYALLRLVREYPREPLVGAVAEAARYGLYDLDRLERMILRRVTREYFLLDGEADDD